jgi:hypothetical protein
MFLFIKKSQIIKCPKLLTVDVDVSLQLLAEVCQWSFWVSGQGWCGPAEEPGGALP